MNILKTPFKLNDTEFEFNIEIQNADLIMTKDLKPIHNYCEVHQCGAVADHTWSRTRGVRGLKGNSNYCTYICDRHLIDAINKLGIKED
jgi:hypothetical protein